MIGEKIQVIDRHNYSNNIITKDVQSNQANQYNRIQPMDVQKIPVIDRHNYSNKTNPTNVQKIEVIDRYNYKPKDLKKPEVLKLINGDNKRQITQTIKEPFDVPMDNILKCTQMGNKSEFIPTNQPDESCTTLESVKNKNNLVDLPMVVIPSQKNTLNEMNLDQLGNIYENLVAKSGIDLEKYLELAIQISSRTVVQKSMENSEQSEIVHSNNNNNNNNCIVAKIKDISTNTTDSNSSIVTTLHTLPTENISCPSTAQEYIATPNGSEFVQQPTAVNPKQAIIRLNDPRILKRLMMLQKSSDSLNIRQLATNLTNYIPMDFSNSNSPTTTFSNTSMNFSNSNSSNAKPGFTLSKLNYGEYKSKKAEEEQKRLECESMKIEAYRLKTKQEAKKNEIIVNQVEEKSQKPSGKRKKHETDKEQEEHEQEQDEGEEEDKQQRKQKSKREENLENEVARLIMELASTSGTKNTTINKETIEETIKKRIAPYKTEISNLLQEQTTENLKEIEKAKQIETINKTNRALKGLTCTVKGFDTIQGFITNSSGKRQSNITARSAISQQLCNRSIDEDYEDDTYKCNISTNQPAPKRRKTIDCRNNFTQEKTVARTRTANRSKSVYIEVKEKQSLKIEKRRRSSKPQRSTSVEPKKLTIEQKYEKILKNQPRILLKRCDDNQNLIHPRLPDNNILNTELKTMYVKNVPSCSSTTKLETDRITSIHKALIRKNVDCEMTERNTKYCVLCKSKPFDLISHYIRNHKTESYVSRFTSRELDDLQFNTCFADVAVKSSRGNHKYKIKCAFCNEEIIDSFSDFHDHFSTHTGEFAYQCASCGLLKPYRCDIQSHQKHCKGCRSSKIQTKYTYSTDLMVIYIHCCDICNFVQLNEANIFKHLKDHHYVHKNLAKQTKKYILVAVKNNEEDSLNTSILCGTSVENEPLNEDVSENRCKNNLLPNAIKNQVPAQLTATDSSLAENRQNISDKSSTNGIPEQLTVINSFVAENRENMSDKYSTNGIPEQLTVINSSVAENREIISDKSSRNGIPEQLTVINSSVVENRENMSDKSSRNGIPEQLNVINSSVAENREIISVKSLTNCIPEQLNVINSSVAVNRQNITDNISTPNENSALNITNVSAQNINNEFSNEEDDFLLSINKNSPPTNYRYNPVDAKYAGLYKCMVNDCSVSTDDDHFMLSHINDHMDSDIPPENILCCSYCKLDAEKCTSPEELINHVRKYHIYSRFQCPECNYRSCVAPNVVIHRNIAHKKSQINSIFEGYGPLISGVQNSKKFVKLIEINVQELKCPFCPYIGCYSLSTMKDHLKAAHLNMNINQVVFHMFACIFCKFSSNRKGEMQIHMAIKHPDEMPFVCTRLKRPNVQLDDVKNLTVINVSPSVKIQNMINCVEAVKNANSPPAPIQSMVPLPLSPNQKPTQEKLIEISTAIVIPLLHKLTAHTGVSSDKLYQCPINSCGAIFSIYSLWLRHIQLREHMTINLCPHCPHLNLKIEESEEHFEIHRKHSYICMKCCQTFGKESQIYDHTSMHSVKCSALEYIKVNDVFSYGILTYRKVTDKLSFIESLLVVVRRRLEEIKDEKDKQILCQWNVPMNSSWLEDIPQYIDNMYEKKCLIFTCKYRAKSDYELFKHLRANHPLVKEHIFKCYKCGVILRDCCGKWDNIEEHIRMHNSNIYFCCICGFFHYESSIIKSHIVKNHDFRDVPMLLLNRSNSSVYVSISIVFAAYKKTFTNYDNCICCNENISSAENMKIHLKTIHGLNFSYFCEYCDENFKKVSKCDEHFKLQHVGTYMKIRCQFSTKNDIKILSNKPLLLEVNQLAKSIEYIKEEPHSECSDTEDEFQATDAVDVEPVVKPTPKIACVNIQNLLAPQTKNVELCKLLSIPSQPPTTAATNVQRVFNAKLL